MVGFLVGLTGLSPTPCFALSSICTPVRNDPVFRIFYNFVPWLDTLVGGPARTGFRSSYSPVLRSVTVGAPVPFVALRSLVPILLCCCIVGVQCSW